jgi:hypothetical protein
VSEKSIETDIREIKLGVWEEIVGDCVKFEVKKDQVVVIFRHAKTCR